MPINSKIADLDTQIMAKDHLITTIDSNISALEAANASASVLFGSVDTDGVAILAYNSESQSWEQLTADTVIKPLTGYWIYSNGTVEIPLTYVSYPTVPAVKQLYPGWNAVGVSAETSIPLPVIASIITCLPLLAD